MLMKVHTPWDPSGALCISLSYVLRQTIMSLMIQGARVGHWQTGLAEWTQGLHMMSIDVIEDKK